MLLGGFVVPGLADPGDPPPPPNPTDQQLADAQKAKDDTAATVGMLSAKIAQAQSQLQQLAADAELAGQKYALAVSNLQQAKDDAAKAQQDVADAEAKVVQARQNLVTFAQQSYKSARPDLGPAGLLTANDPNMLLESGDYTRFVADRHLDAKSGFDRATVEKSNADAKAREAVATQTKLTDEANRAQQAAMQAVKDQQAQQASLEAQMADWQNQLTAAQANLATLNGQREAFNAWQAEMARLAAERERQRQEALARARAEAAARAAAAAAAARAQTSSSHSAPVQPTNGNCTQPNPADRAVCFAMQWLGQDYAWAGGNINGPTYGVNSPGTDGWNDSQVYGFDCSGLTLYAWYQASGLRLAHYAATQYTQAGSVHPRPGQFQPGDLLFWSSNGTIAGIHHVAMYIGNGNVIQAPNSGDVVQVTAWDDVSSDYFGATRPLT